MHTQYGYEILVGAVAGHQYIGGGLLFSVHTYLIWRDLTILLAQVCYFAAFRVYLILHFASKPGLIGGTMCRRDLSYQLTGIRIVEKACTKYICTCTRSRFDATSLLWGAGVEMSCLWDFQTANCSSIDAINHPVATRNIYTKYRVTAAQDLSRFSLKYKN